MYLNAVVIPSMVVMTFCPLSLLKDLIGDVPPGLQKLLSVGPGKKLFTVKLISPA